jgi:polysaccharide biosynthesis/export protein
MKRILLTILALAAVTTVAAQQSSESHSGGGVTTEGGNLPVVRIGNNDLIGVTVYDAPELTRTVRVSQEGDIRLPMVKKPIHAAGLYPADLEKAITAALTSDNVLVDPVVTVSIVEYQSHPITVVGYVRTPVSFQAIGDVTLLDAISRAGGISENAGNEVLVSRQQPDSNGNSAPLVQRIPLHNLLNGSDPSLNIHLQGGEEIRVPEAGRVYVVGQVKKPGPYYIDDGAESSVLKALAYSEGLDTHWGSEAYIYRQEGGLGGKNEVQVDLKKILQRKSPDVVLEANDILYVPRSNTRANVEKVVEVMIPIISILTVVGIEITHR